MQFEAENKAMSPEAEQPQPITVKAVSALLNEYHFPGSGKWKPVTVTASSIDEATEQWKAKRVPVEEETNNA